MTEWGRDRQQQPPHASSPRASRTTTNNTSTPLQLSPSQIPSQCRPPTHSIAPCQSHLLSVPEIRANQQTNPAARDLLRRLNPKDTSKNVDRLCQLAPSLTEDLLESVDVPLAVKRCSKTKRDFLCCDYNRDGDSWRSPWSNEFEPSLEDGEGVVPSERVRKMELKANEAFDVYREL